MFKAPNINVLFIVTKQITIPLFFFKAKLENYSSEEHIVLESHKLL